MPLSRPHEALLRPETVQDEPMWPCGTGFSIKLEPRGGPPPVTMNYYFLICIYYIV